MRKVMLIALEEVRDLGLNPSTLRFRMKKLARQRAGLVGLGGRQANRERSR